ncbi:MAG: hypothetical protein ACRC80_31265 [Waterburya sp.]
MVLSDSFKRVILWGANVEGDCVKAELAFFASSLRRDRVEMFDRKDEYVCTIKLGETHLRQNFANKAQMVYFELDELPKENP